MLSLTFQRALSRSTRSIAAVTGIVLLMLYCLERIRASSNAGSGRTNYHAAIPEENVLTSTVSTMSAVEDATLAALNQPKRAYVTFLEAYPNGHLGKQQEGSTKDDEDFYFVGKAFENGQQADVSKLLT